MKIIARFCSPFGTKFGIPRQSGLVEGLRGTIVFEPEFCDADYLRGIEGFDYLWLVWGFSANAHKSASPLVRPPVLGGNEKRGVFATRSPYRPNPIGLSSVRLERVQWDGYTAVEVGKSPKREHAVSGPVLHVLGADLMDGTPIYDIKPYIPFSDAHPDARGGFSDAHRTDRLQVTIPPSLAANFSPDDLAVLHDVLACDPRPRYHDDAERVYGMTFMGYDIHFSVTDGNVVVVEG